MRVCGGLLDPTPDPVSAPRLPAQDSQKARHRAIALLVATEDISQCDDQRRPADHIGFFTSTYKDIVGLPLL